MPTEVTIDTSALECYPNLAIRAVEEIATRIQFAVHDGDPSYGEPVPRLNEIVVQAYTYETSTLPEYLIPANGTGWGLQNDLIWFEVTTCWDHEEVCGIYREWDGALALWI